MRVIISIFAMIFLFGIHSKLLWLLNPDKIQKEVIVTDKNTGITKVEYRTAPFSFIRLNDENNTSAMIAAVIFAVITVFILNLFDPRKDWFFWIAAPIFAITDGFGTIIYLFPDIDRLSLFHFTLLNGQPNDIPNTKLLGAFYYGIYVVIFLSSIALIRLKYSKNQVEIISNDNKKSIPTRQELDGWYDRLFKKEKKENIHDRNILTKEEGIQAKEVMEYVTTILSLTKEGWKQKDIAEKLKISQGQVSKTLKKFGNNSEN
jgi:predicted XRE-type DNA-binding protein